MKQKNKKQDDMKQMVLQKKKNRLL